MDRTTSRFDADTLVETSIKPSSRRRGKRATQLIEADRARRVAYESFALALRDELQPKEMLEAIYVDRVILSAWRLREAIDADRAGILGNLGVDSHDIFKRLTEDLRRQANRAESSLRRALDSLEQIRTAGQPPWGQAIKLDTTVVPVDPVTPSDTEIVPNEWTIVPFEEAVTDPIPVDDSPLPRWQDRLVFDANVSDESPVVKGTWVTVSQIVTLVVDGFTWADILRSHPELSEDDIRLCLSYATEQESDDARGVYIH